MSTSQQDFQLVFSDNNTVTTTKHLIGHYISWSCSSECVPIRCLIKGQEQYQSAPAAVQQQACARVSGRCRGEAEVICAGVPSKDTCYKKISTDHPVTGCRLEEKSEVDMVRCRRRKYTVFSCSSTLPFKEEQD